MKKVLTNLNGGRVNSIDVMFVCIERLLEESILYIT